GLRRRDSSHHPARPPDAPERLGHRWHDAGNRGRTRRGVALVALACYDRPSRPADERRASPTEARVKSIMRALLSVYDKTGIVDLGRGLVELGYEIISTGGTL